MIQFENLLEKEKYTSGPTMAQEEANTMLMDMVKKMLLRDDTECLQPYLDGGEAWEQAVSDAAKLRTVKGLFIDGLTQLEEDYEADTLSSSVLQEMSMEQSARLTCSVLKTLRQVEELGIFAGCVRLTSIMYDKNGKYEPYIKNVHYFQLGCFPQTWPEHGRSEHHLPFFDQDLQSVANTRLTAKMQVALGENLDDFEDINNILDHLGSEKLYPTDKLIEVVNNLLHILVSLKEKGKDFGNDRQAFAHWLSAKKAKAAKEEEQCQPIVPSSAEKRPKAAVCTVVAPCASEQSVQFYYSQIAMINRSISAAMDKGDSKPVYSAYAWSGSKQDGFTTNAKEFALFDRDYIPNFQYREEADDMSRFMQSYMAADAMIHLFDEDSDILLFVVQPLYDYSHDSEKIAQYVDQLKDDLGERLNVAYLYQNEPSDGAQEKEPWIQKYTVDNPEHLKQMFGQVEQLVWKGAL